MMKKLIPLIVILTILFKNANAQNPGDYLTNTTLTPFHGTWQWTNGTETLTIFLNTEKTFIAGGQFYSDALMGWHKFERSGIVLVNTYDLRPNHASSSILAGNRINAQVAEGSYDDIYKNKLGAIKILLTSNPDEIILQLSEMPGLRIVDTPGPNDSGFTIPTNITLQRL